MHLTCDKLAKLEDATRVPLVTRSINPSLNSPTTVQSSLSTLVALCYSWCRTQAATGSGMIVASNVLGKFTGGEGSEGVRYVRAEHRGSTEFDRSGPTMKRGSGGRTMEECLRLFPSQLIASGSIHRHT